jgi:hypothetical protein
VRLVIILIVLVFDPLALTLILAANKQFEWARQGRGGFVHDEPAYPPDDGPLTEEQIEQIKESVPQDPSPPGWMFEKPEKSIFEQHPYLLQPFVSFSTPPMPAPKEPYDQAAMNISAEPPGVELRPFAPEEIVALDHDDDDDETDEEIKAAVKQWKTANPDDTIKNQRYKLMRGEIRELPWMGLIADNTGRETQSGFGIGFPESASKGDTFVRVDLMPTKLYKHNGSGWIPVDKNSTDSYTYDSAYIQHLINKISTGEYDPDLLSDSERQQVATYLENNKSNEI